MSEAINSNVIVNHGYNHHKKPPTSKDKKKTFKGSPMNIIKVALYMLRRKGDKTSKKSLPSLPKATNATLTNFVEAIRPFHLQSDVGGTSPPPPPPLLSHENGMAKVMVSPNERFETSPCHPKYAASTSSRSSSFGGGMSSRYASAQSLYDLDIHDDIEEEDVEDAYYDGVQGDEMIDAKADMFIARFYQQMKLQN